MFAPHRTKTIHPHALPMSYTPPFRSSFATILLPRKFIGVLSMIQSAMAAQSSTAAKANYYFRQQRAEGRRRLRTRRG
jgi:hypothetical protein